MRKTDEVIGYVHIYALIDPRDNEVKYVGCAKNTFQRLKEHVGPAKCQDDSKRSRWMKELLENDMKPILQIAETVPFENKDECEKKWIAYYGGQEFLTNSTDGGKGVPGNKQSEETKEIRKKSMKEFFDNLTDEEREKYPSYQAGVKRKTTSNNPSKYVGVHFHKYHRKFNARIQYKGKRIELGLYKTEEEAALAYNKAALIYYGENAKLNIVE